MTLITIALLLALGSTIGFMAGLLGIGGGMLMVPFIALLMENQGLDASDSIKVAVATSLATVVFTSMSSVRAHHAHGSVLWSVALRFTPGILLGALLGARFAATLRGPVLAMCFGLFVAFSATQMLLNRKPRPSRQLPGRTGLAAVGGGIGALSSLVGAGGAFASVPFMIWCNVRAQHAVGTSAALGFPIALAGTVGYLTATAPSSAPPGTFGMVYLPALLAIAIASVVTAPLGARFAHSMSTERLKQVMAFMLYGLCIYMLQRAFAA